MLLVTQLNLCNRSMDDPLSSLGEIAPEIWLKSIVDHVVDGVVGIDERGNVLTFNPAAERLFGYPAAEMIGQNVNILMPEPYRSAHDDYLTNYLRTGHRKIICIGREVVATRQDGSEFPIDLAVSTFRIGERHYFTGIVRDITQRKTMENELHRRFEGLARADRQKNEFLAMLAHELRNPMAAMRNALHLLKLPEVDETMANHAREMTERQLHHLTRLVDDLLDMSRVAQGRMELHCEIFDLSEAVLRAVEMAQPLIERHCHVLSVKLADDRVWINGDLVRLAQAISNLLTNSARYTEQQGHIRLVVRREKDLVAVQVTDNGIGIAAEMLPQVFDLFTQADNTLARSRGGLGIGLTLVKRIVELHGGSVIAASQGVGTGSTFTIRVPMAPPEASVEGAHLSHANQMHLRKKRVLFVDDNVDAVESMAAILRFAGYDVQCHYDGDKALDAVPTFNPDVVILDIGLPGINGYELAQRIRQEPGLQNVKLLAVTGYGQEEDRRRSRLAGFDYHITKPVDPIALERLISGQHATW